MKFSEIAAKLKGKLFLSSMMGTTDTMFCSSRAKGCAMVQLGAFVLSKEREDRKTYWPDVEQSKLTAFMKEQFDRCRIESANLVGNERVPVISANIFPCSDEDTEISAIAFIEAGGNIYELNAHAA